MICVAFSPDGQRIVSGSMDGTARVWDTTQPTAGQLLRRVASSLVAGLFRTPLLKSEVVDRLRRDPKLDESVRQLALEAAERSTEDPNLLNDASWLTARSPRHPREDYLRALRYAEAACRLAPEDGTFLDTRGVARYRAGHIQEALADLSRPPELEGTPSENPLPARLAFTAMSQHQLGLSDRARHTLQQLRDVMKALPWRTDPESKSFLAEAGALIGSPTSMENGD